MERPSPRIEDSSATNASKTPLDAVLARKEAIENEKGQDHAQDDAEYPKGLKLGLILTSGFTSIFLISLDRLIIGTAIPQITDEFHSVNDIGWYGSAYLLTQCSLQLLFGKLYAFFSVKAIFLAALFLFELGSAVCGAAPNSTAFIIGRAIAGSGAGGIQSGVIMIIVHSLPLYKRPLFQGIFGAVFGVSSVAGPLLGGAFTTHVTWRWCFFINLPLGAGAAVAIFFLLNIPPSERTKLSTKEKLAQLDFYGSVSMMLASVCLILALQWGGSTYAWGSARIIVLLTLGGILFLGFCVVQVLLPKTATIAPRIVKQRSILAGSFAVFCIYSQLMIFAYYIPLWFQGIQGVSAVQSGIRFLPTMLSLVVGTLFSGAIVRRIGYYTPICLCGICLMSVGAGLLYTLQVETPRAQWIGYQVVYGLGVGLSVQAPNLAAQTVLPKQDVPIGASLLFFFQLLGGAIFISVGQNILSNQLSQRISSIPGVDPNIFSQTGATSVTNLPASLKPRLLVAYNESLRHVYLVGVVLACLALIGGLFLEWRSTKQHMKKEDIEKEIH